MLKYIEESFLFRPIVINNALISFLLIMEGKIKFPLTGFSAQASDSTLWKSALFAEYIHNILISHIKSENVSRLYLNKVYNLRYQRFSINCVGIFSETLNSLKTLGIPFVPENSDDEEYITSILSAKLNKNITIINDCVVAHFSFYPQEIYLIKNTSILKEYASIADITINQSENDIKVNKKRILMRLKDFIKDILNHEFGIYVNKQKDKYKNLLKGV